MQCGAQGQGAEENVSVWEMANKVSWGANGSLEFILNLNSLYVLENFQETMLDDSKK